MNGKSKTFIFIFLASLLYVPALEAQGLRESEVLHIEKEVDFSINLFFGLGLTPCQPQG